MDMIPVNSSNLASVGYTGGTVGTLYVSFHSGRLYSYSNVPRSVYEGLMSAASHGSYFHAYIRNSYPYQRIN